MNNKVSNNIRVLLELERKINSQLDNLMIEYASGDLVDEHYLELAKRNIVNSLNNDFRFLE